MGDAAKPYVKDILDIIKDKSVDSEFRSCAASALSQMGDAAKPYLKDILDFVKDKSVDSSVRISAVQALGNMGDAAKPYIKDIFDIIKDKSVDSDVRSSTAQALGNIRQLELEEIVIVLDNIYYEGHLIIPKWRFLTYYLSGGTEEVKTLLQWTGYPKKLPNKLTHDEAVKTLQTFAKAWQPTQDLTRLRNDLASKIALVAKKAPWQPQDIILLEQHHRNLQQAGYSEADTLQSVIINLKGWQMVFQLQKYHLNPRCFLAATHLRLSQISANPSHLFLESLGKTYFWYGLRRLSLGLGSFPASQII